MNLNRAFGAVLAVSVMAPVLAPAQEVRKAPLIYARIEGNAGTASGPHFGIAAVVGDRHELGLAGSVYMYQIRDLPSDLDCGCKHGIGNDWIAGASATYAYLLYPGKSQRFWRIALRGGVVAGTRRTVQNFRQIPNALPYDPNYSWDYDTRFAVGLELRPTVDLAINRVFGFSAGPFALLSNDFVGGGVTFGVQLGRISREGAHQRVDAWKKRVRPPAAQR